MGGAAVCIGGEHLSEAGESEGPASRLVGDVGSLGRRWGWDADGSDQHLCLTGGTGPRFI